MCTQCHRRGRGGREQQMLGKGWGAGIVIRDLVSTLSTTFIRLASLGGRPQAHVHMEGKKCRVLYLNLLGMNALFL